MSKVFMAIFILSVCLSACFPDGDQVTEEVQADIRDEEPEIVVAPVIVPQDDRPCLIANIDQLRLRDLPGEQGKVIAELAKGSRLFDLGKVSDFTTRIIIEGKEYDAPWIKVETEKGLKGWVYGRPLNFLMEEPDDRDAFFERKRLQNLFGTYNLERLNLYQEAYFNVHSVEGFASLFLAGTNLRDTLVDVLETKIDFPENKPPPDLFWIKENFPGYVPQLVAEGTAYYLFIDYREFLSLAQQTKGKEDDQFLEISLMAFPEDSVEYFFPAWTIQTWDYGGHSLLGRGIHKEMLTKLSTFQESTDLFSVHVDKLKTDLLNDITRPYVTYWEPKEKILQELDEMLSSELSLLAEVDIIALQTRRKHFEDPVKNGIEVDHQSGIYQ